MDFKECFPSLDLAQSWLQPCCQLRRAELNLPIHCSGHCILECRSMALHVTPQCPTRVSQGCTKGTALVCKRATLPLFLSACAVAPWPGSETQRGRFCGVREIEGLPRVIWSCRPHSWEEAESRTPSVSVAWNVLEPDCFSNNTSDSRPPFGSLCRLVSQSSLLHSLCGGDA